MATKIDLRAFCLKKCAKNASPRTQACLCPWRFGGHVYAYDGYILLCVAAERHPRVKAIDEAAAIVGYFTWRHGDVSYVPIVLGWPKAPCGECGTKCFCHAGRIYRTDLIRRICKYLPNPEIEATPRDAVAMFRFDGGVGYIVANECL